MGACLSCMDSRIDAKIDSALRNVRTSIDQDEKDIHAICVSLDELKIIVLKQSDRINEKEHEYVVKVARAIEIEKSKYRNAVSNQVNMFRLCKASMSAHNMTISDEELGKIIYNSAPNAQQ